MQLYAILRRSEPSTAEDDATSDDGREHAQPVDIEVVRPDPEQPAAA